MMNLVNSMFEALHIKEVEEELLQHQEQGTEVDARTAELHSKQGNTDITELVVIDETDAVRKLLRTQCMRKVLLHMWSNSAGTIS